MLASRDTKETPAWAGRWPRIAVAAVLGWSTSVYPVLAQTPPTPPGHEAPAGRTLPTPPSSETAADAASQDETYTLEELKYLLGPIALYPDPLLALIFPAAALPDQILKARDWLDANEAAVEKNDFSGADAAGWDSSVAGLARFPDVVRMMADHIDWTESIGAAYKLQPQDVSTAIQELRAAAQKLGNLKTTDEQTVTVREEGGDRLIYVTPTDPDRIYVPTYDSTAIYTAGAVALAFTAGYLVGSSWNSRWGWNDRPWRSVWVYQPGWHRPPHWHRPPPHRPPGSWRPDRPDRPGRPGRPDRPGERPDRPGTRPDRPGERPGARPERPDRPAAKPGRPSARPDRPSARPSNRPQARPSQKARPAPQTRPRQQVRPRQQTRPRPQTRPRQQFRPSQQFRQAPQRARPNVNIRRPQQNFQPRGR